MLFTKFYSNGTIISEELKNMINLALSINNQPSAIRYPRDLAGDYSEKTSSKKLKLGKDV